MSEWGAAEWAAAAGIAAALITFAAFLITYAQLRQSRAENQDRRIDEKVKGAIGENLLLISGLTDQARKTLDEAQQSAASIEDINNAVQTIAGDLALQRQNIAAAKSDLDKALASANDVVEKLNSAAVQAGEDVQVISEARDTVEENRRLLQIVEQELSDNDYRILLDIPSTDNTATIVAVPNGATNPGSELCLEIRSLGTKRTLDVRGSIDRYMSTSLILQDFFRDPSDRDLGFYLSYYVVVDRDLTDNERNMLKRTKEGQREIDAIPVDQLAGVLAAHAESSRF
jgi:hypothetical protein